MNLKALLSIFVFLNINLIASGYAERTKDQMYIHFNGRASCFRRLNATHQTGCSSKRDGSTGIIHYVEAQADLDFILKAGAAGNYMPIIPTFLLNRKTIKALEKSGIISGLIVYNDTSREIEAYSHELTCPNERSNTEGTCSKPWNKDGTGLLHEDIPFPVYYVNADEDLKKMKDCFAKFNNFSYESQYTRSLCSIELDTFMYATTDTPTCIRRSNSKTNLNPVKFCDPLGSDNIWAALFPIENKTKNEGRRKFIILAARLDTTSLFHGAFPGAVSPLTGLITLLGTADLLKRMFAGKDISYTNDTNILFMLFNGEAYDYIGSQRMAYDMEKDEFPLKLDPDVKDQMPLIHLEDISLFIELSQLTKSNAVYVHMSDNNAEIKDFYKKLYHYGNFTNILPHGIPLPPASFQSFYRTRPNMSGLIIADHGETYVNKYFNSIYDNVTNINYQYLNITENSTDEIPPDCIQVHTASVTEMLAKSLYWQLTNHTYQGDLTYRIELIDELYNCYLLDRDCKVHQAVQRKKLSEIPDNNYSLYVGVTVASNWLTSVIGLTLGWLTADVVTLNKTCNSELNTPMFQYFNMSVSLEDLNQTACFRTVMNFTDAISPAFIIEDYDWKSGQYSSWTESTWKDLSVRMFLKPSPAHERFTIAMGSITFVMSLIFVYFVKSRSHILFATPENCSPTNC